VNTQRPHQVHDSVCRIAPHEAAGAHSRRLLKTLGLTTISWGSSRVTLLRPAGDGWGHRGMAGGATGFGGTTLQ